MKTVTVETSGNYYLQITDTQITITAGTLATVRVSPPIAYTINGKNIYILEPGKSITLTLNSKNWETNIASPITTNINEVNFISGRVSTKNSKTVSASSTTDYTGIYEEVSQYPSVTIACLSSENGTLYIEFSYDGITTQSSIPFVVTASLNEVHRFTVTRKFFRVRFSSSTASTATYSIQSLLGIQTALTSALNSVIQQDADATLVRPIDFNLAVAQSLYQNTQNTIKDGINADISTATVPEDIWTGGSTYTGFYTGTPEEGEVVVAGADTGTVHYSYLETSTSTDYVHGTVDIAGAGSYSLGHNIYRCNFAYFVSSNTAVFNVGLISIRHITTTANVFARIEVGYSQSYTSAYTVPYGSSIYIDRLSGGVRGSATATLDGYFWYRPYGESPRLRFPFALQFGTLYFDDIDYLVRIPQQTDICPRINTSSANNISCNISYRFIKIKG